jgi:hypothetical protein
MRTRAASLAGAVILLAACRAPDRPAGSPSPASIAGERPSVSPDADRDRLREEALRAARVWRSPAPPIGSADLAANPPGPDAFRTDEVVSCTFRLRASKGWSPKFECALPSGEEVKVKYGRNSVEVFAEVAATRLLNALGFGADRMYLVRAIRCRGCPVYPYPKVEILDALRVGDRHEPVELPEVLDGERDPLLVRQRPEDLGRNGPAEVGVELGQTLGEHPSELTQVTDCHLAASAVATKA